MFQKWKCKPQSGQNSRFWPKYLRLQGVYEKLFRSAIVKPYRYRNVQEFMKDYNASKSEYEVQNEVLKLQCLISMK